MGGVKNSKIDCILFVYIIREGEWSARLPVKFVTLKCTLKICVLQNAIFQLENVIANLDHFMVLKVFSYYKKAKINHVEII